MRKYYTEDTVVIVGRSAEIKALYQCLIRRYRRKWGVASLYPRFLNFPRFKDGELYAIEIDKDGYFQVCNSAWIAAGLVEGWLAA